jgi:hypothetical protein
LCLAVGLPLLVYARKGAQPPAFDPAWDEGFRFPLSGTEQDVAWSDGSEFSLHPDDTFEFQFGQGSGWHGLNLLKVTADGRATYEYQADRGWSRKTFVVGDRGLEHLVEKINALRIFGLPRAYHADVADGTQWCLLIKTGGRRKAIYCDNYFPAELRELAAFVHRDVVVGAGGLAEPVAVPRWCWRQHEQEIWSSIR